MNQDARKIKCPNCGENIDVDQILYHQLDDKLKKKYKDELASERKAFKEQEVEIQNEKVAIEKQKSEYQEKLGNDIEAAVNEEKEKYEKNIKEKLKEEQAGQIKSLQDELKEKSELTIDLNKTKSEVEKLKREKSELKSELELENQKIINEQLTKEKEKIIKSEEEKSQLKIKDLEKKLKDQMNLTEEMKRKQDQGSMQLQGEVLEIAIEEWLAEQFPLDVIEEIKKGERGADCLQIVHTRTRQNCGSIYYESKRTKSFQPSWIEKFKADIRDRNADIGVLVTQSMPSDMDRMGLKDGVWICTFDEFKGICTVLRESIIQMSNAIVSQDNKGDKMGMLYDFLTSNEFQLQMEAIVDGFTQMETDLRSEQRAANASWKKRQKQIDKVLINTTHMYGSIKGIAGNAMQSITLLEHQLDDESD